ncbi:TPA: hypothetical protein ACGUVV_004687 [Vibrio vulnificus]
MMKSKSDFDDALVWLNNATKRVVSSRPLNARYDSEWKNTCIVEKNDSEALKQMVSERQHFYKTYVKSVDSFCIRAAGQEIAHGKIPLQEGIEGYKALLDLITYSAKKTLRAKSALKKGLNEYLDSCYLLAPAAGSFIYQAEFELSNNKVDCEKNDSSELFEDCQSDFVRSMNESLAHNILELSRFTKDNANPSYATLVRNGIDPKLCDSFLKLFSKSAEKLEFSFDWASSCKTQDKSLPTFVVFEENTKCRLQTYKQTLKNSKEETFNNVPVYIEKKCVPMANRNRHVVYFKFSVKDRQFVGNRDIGEETFSSLPVGDYVQANVIAVITDTTKKIELIDIEFRT